ncbi:hypothetical protein [Methanobrevibacter sp.]|uniref:hypothetical protein n=1 Tax=Methanobrevibacter sp. TaxID=66852 RepID=UPI0026DFC081|nr:hypothetical protein [Methanobrevibacter sp.]MDO5859391.1 hypothetical protein [Methanobrevibacter sp.]
MLDEKGNIFIIEAILAITLLLFVFLVFNYTISISNSDYSAQIKESKNAEDIMEILSGKINFTDRTFIGDISVILNDNENSKESIHEVSKLCDEKFSSLKLKNYRFSETNILNDEVFSSSGDYSSADNVSVAIRTYADYSYTLSVW